MGQEKPQVLAVARSEIKYLLGLEDRLFLLEALDELLIPDAYGGYAGYTVRSVYFDGIANEDYWDKKNHEDEKKRIRLRVYHPDDLTAKFEIKRKSFGREIKESLVVSREDGKELLKGNYRVLLHYDSTVSAYAYDLMTARLYRPVSMVEYDRRAYTHEHFNTRITLDHHLRFSRFSYDLFRKNINFQAAMPKDQTILEIKYDRFLFKQIQDVLVQCDLTRMPPSKYGTSRGLLQSYYH